MDSFSFCKCTGFAGSLALAALFVATPVAGAGGPDAGTGASKSTVSVARSPSTDITPANTTPGTYRALVADGSSLFQTWSGDATKWYAVLIEPGKTYVIDALDPNTDSINGSVSGLGVYEFDGTTTPPAETQVDCGASGHAPGLTNFAIRCIVRAFTSNVGNLQNQRLIYIRVDRWINTSFQIRVREATIYGRWTTNGYDFHVELQNTTAESICAQVIFYPNSGQTYDGTQWTGAALTTFFTLTVPPFGAAKNVLPAGTTVGTDNRGTIRIGACPGPVNLNTAGLNVSTYAYNPVTDKFLYFFTNQPNQGNGNSF